MIEQSMCDNKCSADYAAMDDEALALAGHGGDRETRNTLYLRQAALIDKRLVPAKRLASYLAASGAPIEACDIDQEGFVIFCTLLAEWDPERMPFVPFMADMIWRRACKYVRQYQHLRSKRVRMVAMARIRPPAAEGGRSEDGNEVDLLDGMQSARLRTPDEPVEHSLAEILRWQVLIGALRADRRRFVRLRFWGDRSSAQIALWEGCSPRTVNRGLNAALAQLKYQLVEERDAV
ncbi:MAG TPA: hypothetical protein VLQ48_07140 [Chloroflexia bacterium]|nr:hypothetical protein [Chloroflexia bacterium]